MFAIFIYIVAGLGAGIATGLAGLSAAIVISPMLITFLNMDAYTAVGIALASDVLASAASAITYGTNKNIDIKRGLMMLASVLVFTFVGSYVASLLSSEALGGFAVFMTLFLGLRFIIKPVMQGRQAKDANTVSACIKSVVGGVFIGFICGFVGAGGGMMMLLVLTSVLGYELKTAVGTSLMIMSVTALTGSVSHIVLGGLPDLTALCVCVVATLLGALLSSVFANKMEPKLLNRITGVVLTVLGIAMLTMQFAV